MAKFVDTFFDPVWWRNTILNAVIFTLVGILFIIILGIVGEPYFKRAPVIVMSLEPRQLGRMCPGEVRLIHNQVTVENPAIAIYYISVMDKERLENVLGTQITINGVQHPIPGVLEHYIEWTVPDLPPGVYTRSFAARGTDGTQLTVFAYNYFVVPTECGTEPEEESQWNKINPSLSAVFPPQR